GRARVLAPAIEAAGDRNERERRIAPEVIAAIGEAGLPQMLMPASLSGGAADLITYNGEVEEGAAGSPRTAWVPVASAARSRAGRGQAGYGRRGVACTAPPIAREVFGAPNVIIAWGPPAGLAKAIVVEGGYRVTGKWRFASGSANAIWMGGHSTVFEADGKPRL